MEEASRWLRAAVKMFGVVGQIAAAALALGGVFLDSGIGSASSTDLLKWGAGLFVLSGVLVILRHEVILSTANEVLGNRYARKLWEDKIPATPESYLAYVRLGDLRTVHRFWQAEIIHRTDPVSGRSDLHIACEAGHLLIVEDLVKRGANLDVMDREGHTPLMSAGDSQSPGHREGPTEAAGLPRRGYKL